MIPKEGVNDIMIGNCQTKKNEKYDWQLWSYSHS